MGRGDGVVTDSAALRTMPTATRGIGSADWSPASTASPRDPHRVRRFDHRAHRTDTLGKRLNAPNDVIVASDGSVWFTDPGYGILADYEGRRAPFELPTAVYRIDPNSGDGEATVSDLERPDGLCFSPDESACTSIDSSTPYIYVYDANPGGQARNGRIFADLTPASSDGIRCDEDGNRGPQSPAASRSTGCTCRSGRRPNRARHVARAMREPVFRRPGGQPPVHGRQPIGIRAVREHSRLLTLRDDRCRRSVTIDGHPGPSMVRRAHHRRHRLARAELLIRKTSRPARISVVIPARNEEATIGAIVRRIRPISSRRPGSSTNC